MSPEKRMTKQQMKGDRLVSTTFKATEYIQQHKTPFTIGVVAIVAVFLIVMALRWNANKKRDEAAALMARAEMEASMGQMEQAVGDLQMIIDQYSGTPSAGFACYTLANFYFDNRDYDSALGYFNKILNNYTQDKLMTASAAAGAGACLETKGDYLGAARLYRQAADLSPGELWAPGYLLKAGENFAKGGDTTSAQAAYDDIQNKYPNSSENSAARRLVAELRY